MKKFINRAISLCKHHIEEKEYKDRKTKLVIKEHCRVCKRSQNIKYILSQKRKLAAQLKKENLSLKKGDIEKLDDSYIRDILKKEGVPNKLIDSSMIASKRIMIQIERFRAEKKSK